MQDSDLQLAACFEKANYTSVWCAIDDVSAENGTLTLIPLSDAAGGALVAADPDVTDPAFDPPSAVTMSLQAGDAVMFDSSVWHRSGPNQSLSFRRALYCQYSEHVITSKGAIPLPSFDPRRQGPLSFAVPCNL